MCMSLSLPVCIFSISPLTGFFEADADCIDDVVHSAGYFPNEGMDDCRISLDLLHGPKYGLSRERALNGHLG